MTTKNSENSISIQDAIKFQESLRKDIDFDKSDNELTQEQLVKKMVYLAMDEQVEKSVGKDLKKDIDDARKRMELIAKFQEDLSRVIELGKEIEKNFLWQNGYLINHFDKGNENRYFVVTRGMTEDAIGNKSLSANDRVDLAKKILEVTGKYREIVVGGLFAKQEIISALLLAFEKNLNSVDFDLYTKEVGGNDADKLRVQSKEWLELSKQLSGYRKKASEAVDEDIDMDEILPKYIVDNNGDITKNISGIEMKTKGERVVRLTSEANKAEEEIEVKRSSISELLFGEAETYMNLPKSSESKEVEAESQSEKGMSKTMKWFIVIVLSIVALSWGIWSAIGVFILGVIIINVLSGK